MRRFAVVLAIALFAGCSEGEGTVQLSVLPNDPKENLPRGLLQGDTLKLYATELDAKNEPTASFGRTNFTWTSQTPDIIEIPASGLLVTKNFGRGQVTVKGDRSERTFEVWVYPPDARVELSPRDTTLNVGQTVALSSRVTYGVSSVLQEALDSQARYVLVVTNTEILRPSGTAGNEFSAIRSGSTYLRGVIDINKRPSLRDSIRVTVR